MSTWMSPGGWVVLAALWFASGGYWIAEVALRDGFAEVFHPMRLAAALFMALSFYSALLAARAESRRRAGAS